MNELSRHARTLGPAIVGAFALSCAVPPKASTEPTAAKTEKTDDAKAKRKKDEARLKIEVAKMRLEITKTVQKNEEIEAEIALAKARTEREISERELKHFLEVEMPRRLEEGRLRLTEGKDGLQDAKEELAQLEDMYKDGDLADKTREIVLQRGRRRVERAMKWIALQEIEFQTLERHRLPIEKERHMIAHKDKSDALAKVERDTAKAKAERTIALKEAENEVVRQEAELAESEKTGA